MDWVHNVIGDGDLLAIRNILIEQFKLPFDPVYRSDGTTVGRYEYLHTTLVSRGISPAFASWVVIGALEDEK